MVDIYMILHTPFALVRKVDTFDEKYLFSTLTRILIKKNLLSMIWYVTFLSYPQSLNNLVID